MILASLTLDSTLHLFSSIPFARRDNVYYISVFSDKEISRGEIEPLNIAYLSHPYSIRPSYRSVATLDTSKGGERTYLLALQHRSLLSPNKYYYDKY